MQKHSPRHKIILALFALSMFSIGAISPDTAHAFRSVTQESFTDPDYIDYQPKTVVLLVDAQNVEVRKAAEKYLVANLEKRGIKVYLSKKLFPPTREWDKAQRSEIYQRYSIEAGITVAAGASSEQITRYGNQNWGSATTTFSGNTAKTTGQGTSMPVVVAKSQAGYSAPLIDLVESRVAWTTDIYMKSRGLLFVGGKRDAKAAAKAIIKSLIENDHIATKK